MKLLAIDTATEACSVALDTGSSRFYRFEICPQQHSQRLLPMLDEVLKDAGMVLGDVDGLIYGRGPGSFTGVRIATGMIQGLAFGSELNVVGVSTLAAMAYQVINEQGAERVYSAIDARMGEVYFGAYEQRDGRLVCTQEERVCPPDDAINLICGDYLTAGTGWDAYTQLKAKMQGDIDVLYPDARYMLDIGKIGFENGEDKSAEHIQPVYLRDKVTWKKLPGRE